MTRPASPQPGYRSEIDGLRALSVLAVIVNHLHKPWLPNGHLGVDIFFVISGYVITGSLYDSKATALGDFLVAFYTRRIKRLVPSLVLSVAFTGVVVSLFDPDAKSVLKTGAASLFGVSNLYLFRSSTDYFAASTELNVYTHTWSLGVEEQFYVLFPLLLWFLFLRRRASCPRWQVVLPLAALSVASLATFLHFTRTHYAAAFYLMPCRFWELGLGCLLFIGGHHRVAPRGAVAKVAALAALAALVGTLFLPFRLTVPATVMAVALTAIVLTTVAPGGVAYALLTRPSAVWIGAISYSLYLWHWNVLSLSRWTIGIHWWSIPFQLALMFLIAGASHRFLELPLRHARWSGRRWGTIGYGVGSSAMAAAALLLVVMPMNGRMFVGHRRDIEKENVGEVARTNSDVAAEATALVGRCNMTPHHLTGDRYRPKPVVDEAFIAACAGDAGKHRKVLLVGDSFAQVSAPHLAVAARRLGYEFRVLSGYGCPYPLYLREIKAARAAACGEIDERRLHDGIVGSLSAGDLVVVRLYLEKPQYLEYDSQRLPPLDAYDGAIARLAREVGRKGAALLIVGSNPTLSLTQLSSLTPQWFNHASSAETEVIRASDNVETSYFLLLDEHLRTYVPTVGGAYYFSMKPYLCASGGCPLVAGSKLLYFDEQHITGNAYDLAFEDLVGAMTRVRWAATSAACDGAARGEPCSPL